jgi:hypothetical protein
MISRQSCESDKDPQWKSTSSEEYSTNEKKVEMPEFHSTNNCWISTSSNVAKDATNESLPNVNVITASPRVSLGSSETTDNKLSQQNSPPESIAVAEASKEIEKEAEEEKTSESGLSANSSEASSEKDNLNVSYHVLEVWTQCVRSNSMDGGLRSKRTASFEASPTLEKGMTTSLEDVAKLEDDTNVDAFNCCTAWIFQPSHVLPWDLLGFLLVIKDFVIIPLQYLENDVQGPAGPLIEWVERLFWTFDILVAFRTGYVNNEGYVEMKPSKIAFRYIRGRLFLDMIVACCSWVELMVPDGEELGLQAISMLRAIRLVRLLRLVKDQKKILQFMIRSEFRTMIASCIATLILLLLFVHVLACIWYYIRGLEDSNDTPDEFLSTDSPLNERYFRAFHFALALFMGEHLADPRSIIERVFTISVLFIAFVVSAWFVGSLTTAMTRLQIIASQRSAQIAVLNNYLSDNGITRELALRVQRNAIHAMDEEKRNTPEEKVKLLTIISDQLRAEIHYELYVPDIKMHPCFGVLNDMYILCVRSLCHSSVSWLSISRGDKVFMEFDVPSTPCMFFVNYGQLKYSQGGISEDVNAKQFFSEPVVWTTWVHLGTMTATKETRLLAIDAGGGEFGFRRVLLKHKMAHRFMCIYAAHYVQELNRMDSGGVEQDLKDIYPDQMVNGVTEKVLYQFLQAGSSRRPSQSSLSQSGSFVPRRKNSLMSSPSMNMRNSGTFAGIVPRRNSLRRSGSSAVLGSGRNSLSSFR